jgi:DNA-binding transcriptional MerR regulator
MKKKLFSTKQIADLCGVHSNTVRLYEKWGFIAKAERAANNYRMFNETHLRQMQLARVALPGPYPINYQTVQCLVKEYAAGDLRGSMKLAEEYLTGVEIELQKALQAMDVLDNWFENKPGSKDKTLFETRKNVAAALGLSIDALRTWERNGLCVIPKNTKGRLQFSEWDIEKLMIIRLLRNCGYSMASLLNVFINEQSLIKKPSTLLSLNSDGTEFSYVTDRYIEYLEGHIHRATKIVSMLESALES